MADRETIRSEFEEVNSEFSYGEGNPQLGLITGDEEGPDKKQKLNDASVSHLNKGYRHRDRGPMFEYLCKTLIDVPVGAPMPVCESLRCKYLHDVNKFFQSKPPDIADECHVFKLRGHCPRGISCRFGSKHVTEQGRNIVDEVVKAEYEKNQPKTLSFFTKDVEDDLLRRNYDFRKSENILNTLPKSKPVPPPHTMGQFTSFNTWGQAEIDFTEDIDVPSQTEVVAPLLEEPIGPCPQEDLFKLHLAEKKKINWTNKLYLQPFANFGNLPFRRICKEYGADVTCSETVVATYILQGQPFECLLTKRHETEDLFGIQLYGNNPFTLTRCAQLIEEQTNVDFIDLNFGSPGEMMSRGGGLGQVRREKVVETTVRCMSRVATLPLTVSTKLGDYTDEKISSKFLPNYKACEVSMVSVHGRDRDTKQVDCEYTEATAERLKPIPVFGTSDVLTQADYYSMRKQYPTIAGALIGRGALVKPWLFDEIKQQRDLDMSSTQRFEMLRRFVNCGLEHWGSDTKGVELTRRFLLDWMSFLCRYVPVGLLEQPQQKQNEKGVSYIGRNDLEILLGSHDSADWIKISEMLLGPYPEHYQFIPRVRPNYWPID